MSLKPQSNIRKGLTRRVIGIMTNRNAIDGRGIILSGEGTDLRQ